MKIASKTLVKISTILSIGKMYISLTKPFRLYVYSLAILIPIAVLTYQIIPPLIVANIIDQLINCPNQNWMSYCPLLGLFFGSLILGDVVLWRVIDNLQWKLEGKIIRNISRDILRELDSKERSEDILNKVETLKTGYVRFADTTVYQLLPLLSNVVFISLILLFKMPILSLAFMILVVIYIGTAICVTNTTHKSNAFYEQSKRVETKTFIKFLKSRNTKDKHRFINAGDEAYKILMRASISHTWQQTYFKIFICNISVLSLLAVLIGITSNITTVGFTFVILSYTNIIVLHLFTFSNNTIKSYRSAFDSVK